MDTRFLIKPEIHSEKKRASLTNGADLTDVCMWNLTIILNFFLYKDMGKRTDSTENSSKMPMYKIKFQN